MRFLKKYWANLIISLIIVTIIIVIIVLIILKKVIFTNEFSISDILTTLSLIVALYASITSYLQSNKNLEELKKQHSDQQKKNEYNQARLISSWKVKESSEDINNQDESHIIYDVTIQNNSNSPVYNFYIFTVTNKSSDKFNDVAINNDLVKFFNLIKPGSNEIIMNTYGNEMGGVRPAFSMFFKDENQIWWYKSFKGTLKKVSEEEINQKLNGMLPIFPSDN